MSNKPENIIKMSLDQIMSDRFGRYAKYIIQGRALPDARDGLKPVQRRIMFSMFELGLFHNKPFKKSARVVGDVIGKYHPHGDSSIYEAMVRMSQSWKMNMPLIEMHGNNGSIDDDPAAAMRYTEARLENLSEFMLRGIKKDTVPFAPNFDDSEREPTVLPAIVPNLLINGARGIAAGYATEMPPHNLIEVVDTVITKIKSPNARLETLMKTIKGPDFPTGGIVQGFDGIYSAFERGRGKVVIRSKYVIGDSKTKPFIQISEIPYGVVKSKLVRQLATIQYEKKISGIKEVRDESDRNGISIMIELTSGSDAHKIVLYLLAKTDLQVYYNYNNIAIKDNAPTLMGLSELIDAYLKHQVGVQESYINFELKRDKRRLEIVLGLIRVSEISDEVIRVIRNSSGSKSGVVEDLIKHFQFTKLQAEAIAELRLYRLSRTDQSVYLNERDQLEISIKRYELLLGNQDEFNKHLIAQLNEIKKVFGVPRRSEIQNEMEVLVVNQEDLIKHEDVWVGVSRLGYIKKFSNRAYESNELASYGLKDEDALVYLHKINTADKLLCFTSEGKYAFIPVHLIEESKFKSVGKHINDYAMIKPDEVIVDAISVNNFDLDLYVYLVTSKGKGKRVKISDLKVKRFSSTMVAMKLKDDKLVGAKPSNGHRQLIIINKLGKAVKYHESSLSLQGPKSAGSTAIKLIGEDRVAAFALGHNDDTLGIISQRGGVKRIKVSSIGPMGKTTQGKQIFSYIKGNTHIAIDSAIVSSSDKASFRFKNGPSLSFVEFKKADITWPKDGFSRLGPSNTIDGKIFIFNRIHSDSSLLKNIPMVSEESTFEDAEKLIDSVSQVSIDDLLKDL